MLRCFAVQRMRGCRSSRADKKPKKKKKRRARLIGSLDMAQPKDVLDFRTFFFFFFSHPHDHDDKKKSAKGGREAFKREGGAKKLI